MEEGGGEEHGWDDDDTFDFDIDSLDWLEQYNQVQQEGAARSLTVEKLGHLEDREDELFGPVWHGGKWVEDTLAHVRAIEKGEALQRRLQEAETLRRRRAEGGGKQAPGRALTADERKIAMHNRPGEYSGFVLDRVESAVVGPVGVYIMMRAAALGPRRDKIKELVALVAKAFTGKITDPELKSLDTKVGNFRTRFIKKNNTNLTYTWTEVGFFLLKATMLFPMHNPGEERKTKDFATTGRAKETERSVSVEVAVNHQGKPIPPWAKLIELAWFSVQDEDDRGVLDQDDDITRLLKQTRLLVKHDKLLLEAFKRSKMSSAFEFMKGQTPDKLARAIKVSQTEATEIVRVVQQNLLPANAEHLTIQGFVYVLQQRRLMLGYDRLLHDSYDKTKGLVQHAPFPDKFALKEAQQHGAPYMAHLMTPLAFMKNLRMEDLRSITKMDVRDANKLMKAIGSFEEAADGTKAVFELTQGGGGGDDDDDEVHTVTYGEDEEADIGDFRAEDVGYYLKQLIDICYVQTRYTGYRDATLQPDSVDPQKFHTWNNIIDRYKALYIDVGREHTRQHGKPGVEPETLVLRTERTLVHLGYVDACLSYVSRALGAGNQVESSVASDLHELMRPGVVQEMHRLLGDDDRVGITEQQAEDHNFTVTYIKNVYWGRLNRNYVQLASRLPKPPATVAAAAMDDDVVAESFMLRLRII